MARLAILLGKKHGEEKLGVIAGPGDEREVRAQFKAIHLQPEDYSNIEIWTSDAGRDNRKTFAPPAPPAEQKDAPAQPVIVPSLEEVMKAGYKKKAAQKIVDREQAKADAQNVNPAITQAELDEVAAKITVPAPDAQDNDSEDSK